MGRLVLARRSTALCYTLDGSHVPAGARLELRLPSGTWARGQLMWDGDAYHAPTMALVVIDQEITAEVTVRLPPDAELRWPAPRPSASQHTVALAPP
jgi:hypothetical protein